MTRPPPRSLTVLSTERVSPSMHQVTLGGPGLSDFPPDQAGGYVKLQLDAPDRLSRPLVRTYTIRRQRENGLDIQFALHGGNAAGPATQWALDAQIGDSIMVGGPGPAKPLPPEFDFYLVTGDMSALPAIAANFERLDRQARGLAVIEIQDEADALDMDAPEGIDIRWLVNPRPGTEEALLSDTLRGAGRPNGRMAGWAACEFSSMRNLRSLLRDDWGLGPRELYISSYWKHGLDETAHKTLKNEDAMAEAA